MQFELSLVLCRLFYVSKDSGVATIKMEVLYLKYLISVGHFDEKAAEKTTPSILNRVVSWNIIGLQH